MSSVCAARFELCFDSNCLLQEPPDSVSVIHLAHNPHTNTHAPSTYLTGCAGHEDAGLGGPLLHQHKRHTWQGGLVCRPHGTDQGAQPGAAVSDGMVRGLAAVELSHLLGCSAVCACQGIGQQPLTACYPRLFLPPPATHTAHLSHCLCAGSAWPPSWPLSPLASTERE